MYYTASRRICIDTFTVVCYNYPISATIMQPFRLARNQSGRSENATPHITLGIRKLLRAGRMAGSAEPG